MVNFYTRLIYRFLDLLSGEKYIPPPYGLKENIDPWSGSDGYYIRDVKDQLEKIAKLISKENRIVRTRFNNRMNCAELYSGVEGVIARVKVMGQVDKPYKAVITLLASFPEEKKELFTRFIQLKHPTEFIVVDFFN